MKSGASRALVILCTLFLLGGCSTLVEKHLNANQELIASCETLSKQAQPAPVTLKDYLLALELRAWPKLASCPAASVQLEVVWSKPKPADARLLVQAVGPLLAKEGAPVEAVFGGPEHPSTLTIGGVTYAGVRFLNSEGPDTYVGVLKSARLAPVTISPGGTVNKEVAGGISLIACGLAQGLPGDQIHLPQLESLRNAISKVETSSTDVSTKWVAFREFVKARESELRDDNRKVAYREWLFGQQTPKLLEVWFQFENSLRQLALDMDALDAEVRKEVVGAAGPAIQADMLVFIANARATLRKAKAAIQDEAQILRDYAKGRIAENFALKYLNLVDRSLLPLERGFEKVDEQAYGLGSVALFLGGNPFTDTLSKSYVSFRAKLCQDGSRCGTIWREWDQAVGRASCKRLDEPLDSTQSGVMMQYVYRFYARVGTGEQQAPGSTGASRFLQVSDDSGTGARAARYMENSAILGKGLGQVEGQLTQHALAEWSVRSELLAREARNQLRGLATAAIPQSLNILAPDESLVEEQAMAQAATQVVEAWGQAAEDKTQFVDTIRVQNTINVSQRVAVKVVNQQTVVNNLRFEAAAPAAPRVRIAPGAVQVNIPITTIPGSMPGVQSPALPTFCPDAAAGRCSDMSTGFLWTISDYDPRSPTPRAARFSPAEYDAMVAGVRRVEQVFPRRRIRIEVHGFASDEPYGCQALRNTGVQAESRVRDYALTCAGNGNANPSLSSLRASHVWTQLNSRLSAGGLLELAPPFAHGDFVQPSSRKVEIRVIADPV